MQPINTGAYGPVPPVQNVLSSENGTVEASVRKCAKLGAKTKLGAKRRLATWFKPVYSLGLSCACGRKVIVGPESFPDHEGPATSYHVGARLVGMTAVKSLRSSRRKPNHSSRVNVRPNFEGDDARTEANRCRWRKCNAASRHAIAMSFGDRPPRRSRCAPGTGSSRPLARSRCICGKSAVTSPSRAARS